MSSSSYKKIDNFNDINSDELEKSSFVKQTTNSSSSSTNGASKPAKKTNYGSLQTQSLANNQTATAFLVNHRHRILPGETLQGISLKYSVPIDVIKRANRLWSNDLAFVKDFLIVPIDREKLRSLNIDYDYTSNGTSSLHTSASNSSILNSNNINITTTLNTNRSNDSNTEEYKSYLNKFDSFINESKLKLKHLETNSNITITDYLRTNKTIFNTNGSHFDTTTTTTTAAHNSELDNEEDIFDIGGRYSNASSTTSNSTKNKSRTLNTSSLSSGYDSSKLSSSDTNQTLNLNGALSSNSSSASNLNALSNENISCDSPELLIKTKRNSSITNNNINKNYYGSSHNIKLSNSNLTTNGSRARLAQENLQRLEREKDDLYEL